MSGSDHSAVTLGRGKGAVKRAAGVYAAGAAGSGATATSFLLPLVLGISVFTFLATIVIMLAPSEADIVADAQLAERLAERPISRRG